MYDTATIYPDGSLRIDGYVPNKWRLMGLNERFAVIHSPGQNWSDNGGQHYGSASIEVKEIRRLTRGNAPGTWRLEFVRLGLSISFHPQPGATSKDVAAMLEYQGDELAERIAKRLEEKVV